MHHNEQEKIDAFADRLRAILEAGWPMTEEIGRFIRSSYGEPDRETLAAMLNDPEETGTEPLMELLFFPDRSVRIALEPALGAARFTEDDEARVIEKLSRERLQATLLAPGDGDRIDFSPPEWAVEQFVNRLKIAKQADERLAGAVDARCKAPFRARIKVDLRHSRFDQNEKTVRFFCNFLERIAARDEELPGLSAYVMAFLSDVSPAGALRASPNDEETQSGNEPTIYEALMTRKKQLFQSLCQWERLRERMEKHNMETLLLQGVRVVQIDPEATRAEMNRIDRIAMAVFGRTEVIEPQAALDMGRYSGREIAHVVDALSGDG